jgi:hypothetical protein
MKIEIIIFRISLRVKISPKLYNRPRIYNLYIRRSKVFYFFCILIIKLFTLIR